MGIYIYIYIYVFMYPWGNAEAASIYQQNFQWNLIKHGLLVLQTLIETIWNQNDPKRDLKGAWGCVNDAFRKSLKICWPKIMSETDHVCILRLYTIMIWGCDFHQSVLLTVKEWWCHFVNLVKNHFQFCKISSRPTSWRLRSSRDIKWCKIQLPCLDNDTIIRSASYNKIKILTFP